MTCENVIRSEEYRDFIISRSEQYDMEAFQSGVACTQEISGLYQCIYVMKDRADPVDFGRYPYATVPKCYSLLGTDSLWQAGILQMQNYPGLELMGSGVMIGFVDTGIRYDSPIFRNLDGSTRIAGIWDQTIEDDTPPQGFFYGTEYTQERINRALLSDDPYQVAESRDQNGHGTFLAGIAAGGAGNGADTLGAAPEATIGVVKLKPAKQYLREFYRIPQQAVCYQENDIMLGIRYLQQLAGKLDLPLLLCLALGTNQGSHDGTSPLCGMLELFANSKNTALVIAGGNEADQRHHYMGRLADIHDTDEVEIYVGEGNNGFSMELWSTVPDLVSVSVLSPSGEKITAPSIRRGETMTYRFVLERTTLSLNYMLLPDNTNAELVFFRFVSPVAGIWRVSVTPKLLADGIFHMWLPMTEQQSTDVYFLASDPDYTITEPGNVISGLTVGFYNGSENSIAIRSGRGYTRSNRIKPDLVAPGVDVSGLSAVGQTVTRTGSSIAAGIAAGATALLMEWIVYRTDSETGSAMQIRNLLLIGAEQRPDEVYPNREWGYGSLNLYHTFDVLRRL